MSEYITEADKIKNEIINLINLPYSITIKLINVLHLLILYINTNFILLF
jgi:hypothetical protein